MDKGHVAYTHNGVLLNHRKEWRLVIYSTDEPKRDYAKRSKSNRGRQILYDFISLICGIQKAKQMNKQNKRETDS